MHPCHAYQTLEGYISKDIYILSCIQKTSKRILFGAGYVGGYNIVSFISYPKFYIISYPISFLEKN
jgi:hypothetical protein